MSHAWQNALGYLPTITTNCKGSITHTQTKVMSGSHPIQIILEVPNTFFDDQKGPFFNACHIKMLQHEKTLPGVEPLNSVAADVKSFAAGVSFTKGWLFQVYVWSK